MSRSWTSASQQLAKLLLTATTIAGLQAGPAQAMFVFQQALAVPSPAVEFTRLAEEERSKLADVTDAVNPTVDDSPAQKAANAVVGGVEAAASRATSAVPEAVRPDREALVARLQKDILPKIESQIAELDKAEDPDDATKQITTQLKTVQTDIHHLLKSVQEGDNDAIQADAAGLQKEFEALRAAIPKINGKQND